MHGRQWPIPELLHISNKTSPQVERTVPPRTEKQSRNSSGVEAEIQNCKMQCHIKKMQIESRCKSKWTNEMDQFPSCGVFCFFSKGKQLRSQTPQPSAPSASDLPDLVTLLCSMLLPQLIRDHLKQQPGFIEICDTFSVLLFLRILETKLAFLSTFFPV